MDLIVSQTKSWTQSQMKERTIGMNISMRQLRELSKLPKVRTCKFNVRSHGKHCNESIFCTLNHDYWAIFWINLSKKIITSTVQYV